MDRRLAAILSADVQGYSRLMGDDEGATIATLTEYRQLMTALTEQHHGRVVDSPGDNLLAEFPSAVEAVTGAVEIQSALAEKNSNLALERQMHFRIGINVGDLVADSGRIYGDGVNIAARLESLADGGGICVSGTVYDQVATKLDLTFNYRGEQLVKNIHYPIRVYKLELDNRSKAVPDMETAGVVVEETDKLDLSVDIDATVLNADKPSIAVLPFTNMSNDPEQEYFSDGITEDLITDLSQISGLFVVARNSVFTYKGTAVKPQQIREELGVRYLLEGSIRKSGNRIRINAQLIDTEDGGHLWAQRFDRELDDIFAVQDQVTQEIVKKLRVKLSAGEAAQLEQNATQDIEAYDCFWRGVQSYNLRTPASNLDARRFFERAISIDPNYADAVAYLSRTYISQWANSWSPESDALERGLQLARDAVALNEVLPLAHLALGFAHLWCRDYERALAEAQHAVQLNPNDAESCAALADILNYVGKPQDAITLLIRAQQLDPHYPVSYLFNLGRAYYLLGDYQQAETLFRRILTRSPEHLSAHGYLAGTCFELDNLAEARFEFGEMVRLNPALEASSWRHLPYRDTAVLERISHAMEMLSTSEPPA